MLALRRLCRAAPLSRALSTAAAPDEVDYKSAKVDKAALGALRKKTGFSFVNCKKALVKFPGDAAGAEAWLRSEAAAAGWEKAAKVGGRRAAEGLVGLATSGPIGALVELNCETDFVSRGSEFRALVAAATFAAIRLAASLPPGRLDVEGQQLLDVEIPDLGVPQIPANQRLGDFLTATLAKLGENLQINRASFLTFDDKEVKIVGYAHPRPSGPAPGGVMMGTFGTLVAIRRDPAAATEFPTETLGQQMCQQIIGMSPTCVGTERTAEEEAELRQIKEDTAKADQEKREKLAATAPDEGEEGLVGSGDEDERTQLDVAQKELLRQDFLLHPQLSVAHHLQSHGASVLDFVRFKCGETKDEEQK